MDIKTQKSGDNSLNLQADQIDISYTQHINNIILSIKESKDEAKRSIIQLIEKGETENAEKEIDKIRDLEYINISSNLIEIADLYALADNKKKANECYSKAVDFSPADPKALNIYALYLMDHGKINDAKKIFEKALDATSDEETRGKILGNIGVLHKNSGDLNAAIDLLSKAIKLATSSNSKFSKIRHINNLGSCYNNTSRYLEAEDQFNKALELLQKSLSESTSIDEKQELKSIKANILTNKSIRCRHQFLEHSDVAFLKEAEGYLNLAIEISETLDDDAVLGRHLGNLANIYRLQDKHKKNRESLEKAKSCFDKAGTEKDKITNLLNIGISYLDEEKPNEALDYFEEVLRKDNNVYFPRIHALTYDCMAHVYKKLNRKDQEKLFVKKAYSYYQKLGMTQYLDGLKESFEINDEDDSV
jgi:tetratricopeptide (TPR) repeat protein